MFDQLPTVQAQLKVIIAGIVIEHQNTGARLTWALLHAIELQAMNELQQSGLDQACISMIRPHRPYPHNDEPVEFGGAGLIPIAYAMIQHAFSTCEYST